MIYGQRYLGDKRLNLHGFIHDIARWRVQPNGNIEYWSACGINAFELKQEPTCLTTREPTTCLTCLSRST